MSKMKIENARVPEQARRMEDLKQKGLCFFCEQNYLKVGGSPPFITNERWYVKDNDYPYSGTVNHILIVPKRHVTRLDELNQEEWNLLFPLLSRLKASHHEPGEAMFVRSGDMRYTGGTLDHLHFHYVVGTAVGDDTVSIKTKIGYRKTSRPDK